MPHRPASKPAIRPSEPAIRPSKPDHKRPIRSGSDCELPTGGRGNTTYGTHRRGYKGGRTSIHPKDADTYLAGIRLSNEHSAILWWLGDGSTTAGAMRLLNALAPGLPPGVAFDRVYIRDYVRDYRKSAAAQVAALLDTVRAAVTADDADAAPSAATDSWDDVPQTVRE